MVLVPSDERPHAPEDGDAGWVETWVFDFAAGDARFGGRVQVSSVPARFAVVYSAYVVGRGRRPVVVLDDSVPAPRNGGLELRTEGLWADHILEEPFEHFGVGCEAFGLEVDAGETVTMDVRGDRVPFGLDLGWETAGPVHETAGSAYDMGCDVVGQVLVGNEVIELDGIGWRSHRWGPPVFPPSAPSWLWGRTDDGRWITAHDEPALDPTSLVPVPHLALGNSPSAGPAGAALARFRDTASRTAGTGWYLTEP